MESTLHYTSVSHCDSLMSNINKMRLNSDMCDVTIVVGNFRVMAHKLILSATAPFFYEMLKPNHEIDAEPEYQLKDLDETSALKIIDFCYTSAISVDEDTVWPLLLASSKLGCSEIVECCCEFLTSALDLSTCIQTQLMAYRYNYTSLLSNTRHFIEDNYKKLYGHSSIQTLATSEIIDLMVIWKNSPEKLHAKFAESWLQYNTKERSEISFKLVKEFPDVFNDLQHYLKQENIQHNDCDLTNDGDSVSANQSHSEERKEDLQDQSVPLHVCVSCGDAFPCSLELTIHQKVCEESARISPSNELQSQNPVDSNLYCSENIKSDVHHLTGTPSLEETDFDKTLPLISQKIKSVLGDDIDCSACLSPSVLSKKTIDSQDSVYVHTNVDVDIEDKQIESLDEKSHTLNDTNNNDIHSLPTDDDSDDNSEEIDVVNDNYEKDYQCLKINLLKNHSRVVSKCQICEKTFSDRKHLSKHWKCVHGVKEKMKDQKYLGDSSFAEDGDHIDVSTSNKKLRTEENISLSCREREEKNPDSIQSEFLKHYLHQYSEFTRWCMEQGATWCQTCLIYHSRDSICPLNNGEGACMEGKNDTETVGMVGDSDDIKIENTNHEGNKSDEGPLDMTTRSSSNSSDVKSLNSTSSSYFPSPLEISQYYNNLSHMMATNQHNITEGRAFLGSNVESYINFSPSSLFPTNVDNNVPSYGHHGQDKNSSMNSTLHHKKKVTSRQRFFPCTVCHRVFSYQAALFTHMRTHSPSVQIYQCPQCHQNFAQSQDLKTHLCPNGVEKPYICSSCGQTFAKNIHLKRHLATHSGLKPYPCWLCGKRFSRSDHLKRHTQSIHAGSRPHGCQTCGKEFVRKYELNKHLLIHNNYTTSSNSVALDLKQSIH